MVRTLSLLAIAGLLVLAQCCIPADALSGTLWDVSTTGGCSASDSRVVGSLTHLDSGQCVKVGQYGASVRCTADGQVTQAALFNDYSCSIVAFSGSGIGDGISCIRMSSRNDPGFYFSTVVNCAAPGAEQGKPRDAPSDEAEPARDKSAKNDRSLTVSCTCWLLAMLYVSQLCPPPPKAGSSQAACSADCCSLPVAAGTSTSGARSCRQTPCYTPWRCSRSNSNPPRAHHLRTTRLAMAQATGIRWESRLAP